MTSFASWLPYPTGTSSYDQLHHFIASGVWESAPLATVLLGEADRMVGGDAAWLIVDGKALPKKGRHSIGVAPRYASALCKMPTVRRWCC